MKTEPRLLANKHTGEILAIRRVKRGNQIWLEINGSMPPGPIGPPMHVHYAELEEATVTSGTLAAIVDGREVRVVAGGHAAFPPGSVHRWWNGGEETLVFGGYARPVVDLDRYLQAAFEVFNAGANERPPMFYMAHIAWRHRRTQGLRMAPAWILSLAVPVIVGIGTLLGKYRGIEWPGCPARCSDAPFCSES
jgi:mannose-6-phosphate isomerase-like protein (cupin superfamily)